MREGISIIIMFLGMQLPWSNGYTFTLSIFMTLGSMLFLSMCIIDRLFIQRKHRIGDDLPTDFDIDKPPTDLRALNNPSAKIIPTDKRINTRDRRY